MSKRKYKAFMEWREELNEIESSSLLPDMFSRLEDLKSLFNEIISICENEKNNPLFSGALKKILKQYDNDNDSIIGEISNYLAGIQKMVKESYIDELDELLKTPVNNIKELSHYFTRINHLCVSITNIKHELFAYRIQSAGAMVSLLNKDTISECITDEHKVVWMPFKNIEQNIHMIAEATYGTIQHWHKEQIKWKTEFLRGDAYRKHLRNQISTILMSIIVAFTIGIICFLGQDKYAIYRLKKELNIAYERIEHLNNNQSQNDVTKNGE